MGFFPDDKSKAQGSVTGRLGSEPEMQGIGPRTQPRKRISLPEVDYAEAETRIIAHISPLIKDAAAMEARLMERHKGIGDRLSREAAEMIVRLRMALSKNEGS